MKIVDEVLANSVHGKSDQAGEVRERVLAKLKEYLESDEDKE